MMQKQDIYYAPRNAGLLVILAASFALACLSGCGSNPKQRDDMFKTFVTSVVNHMMDRNPDTMKASMTVLFRDELTEPVIEKLQKQNVLPHTELGILKVVDEEEDEHETGTVRIDSVKALGPVDKPVVPYEITGATILKTSGKPDVVNPFTVKLSCKINEESGGYPQVIDASVSTPVLQAANNVSAPTKVKKRKRKRH